MKSRTVPLVTLGPALLVLAFSSPGLGQEAPPAAAETPEAETPPGEAAQPAPSDPGVPAPAETQPAEGQTGAPENPPEGSPETPPPATSTMPQATPPPAPEPAPSAPAEDAGEKRGPNMAAVPDLRGTSRPTQRHTIGLEPGAPQATAIAGGVTPAFGQPSASSSDWVFDIHGFLFLPLRIGLNSREDAVPGQKVTVLHTPPVVPGSFETFEYTGINPDPWAQLNFSYGNRDVTATMIIAARTVSNANGYYNPADQLGINDAFVSFRPRPSKSAAYNVHVGAFANRYGAMGEYDLGRYGTPVIARISGMGATATGTFGLGEMVLDAELGAMGQLNKAPVGVEPAGWNGFTDPNAGTSFALHAHAALGITRQITVGLHGIHTFAQDDRATTTTQPDGQISVLGADLRLSLQRYGHFYFGYGFTNAETARSVSGVIRVLNAQGGLGLMQEYFGLDSDGTGQLSTFGAEYDLSLGNLLRNDPKFEGQGPDLALSLFGLATAVASPDPTRDGIFKLKYGGEATYTFLRWMGAGIRYDRVLADAADDTQTHAIISPRLIWKSDWASRDQVMLQYSAYLNGSNVAPVVGYPPAKDVTVRPDEHVLSLSVTMWW